MTASHGAADEGQARETLGGGGAPSTGQRTVRWLFLRRIRGDWRQRSSTHRRTDERRARSCSHWSRSCVSPPLPTPPSQPPAVRNVLAEFARVRISSPIGRKTATRDCGAIRVVQEPLNTSSDPTTPHKLLFIPLTPTNPGRQTLCAMPYASSRFCADRTKSLLRLS